MNKLAVIRIKGKQHKVSEGDELLIDKVEDPKKLETEVLLVSDGKKIKVGKPLVKDAKIKISIVEEEVKGKKLHIRTYKAKSRYRRHVGFRPKYTKIKVEKIS